MFDLPFAGNMHMVNCKYSRLTVLAIGLAIGPFHFVEPLTIPVHISEAHVSLPVILYL